MNKLDEIEKGLATDDPTLEWTSIKRTELLMLVDYVKATEKLDKAKDEWKSARKRILEDTGE